MLVTCTGAIHGSYKWFGAHDKRITKSPIGWPLENLCNNPQQRQGALRILNCMVASAFGDLPPTLRQTIANKANKLACIRVEEYRSDINCCVSWVRLHFRRALLSTALHWRVEQHTSILAPSGELVFNHLSQ